MSAECSSCVISLGANNVVGVGGVHAGDYFIIYVISRWFLRPFGIKVVLVRKENAAF